MNGTNGSQEKAVVNGFLLTLRAVVFITVVTALVSSVTAPPGHHTTSRLTRIFLIITLAHLMLIYNTMSDVLGHDSSL